jgi:hypothetical protein
MPRAFKNAKLSPPARKTAPRGYSISPVLARSSCACGGGCPRCQARSALPISHPGDALEREADRVAEIAMSNSARGVSSAINSKEIAPSLARSAQSSAPSSQDAPPIVRDTLRSPGRPLDATTRNFFEPRLGHDLSDVRLHTDAQAARSARSVEAHAYTVGSHIAFDAGRYAPTTNAGQRLLAHELAHVIQQRDAAIAPAIQRQAAGTQSGGAAPAGAGVVQTAGTVHQYLAVICEVIADIRGAIEQGRVWDFEDEVRLAGDQMVGNAGLPRGRSTLTQRRIDLLTSIVSSLDELGQRIESGAQPLTLPATRLNVARLWHGSRPRREFIRGDRIPLGHLSRWTDPLSYERESPRSNHMTPVYPSPAYYIARAAMPTAGVLHPGLFPTWWVSICGPADPATPPPRPVSCFSQGHQTGRLVVLAPPPRGPHVHEGPFITMQQFARGETNFDGPILPERRDARGNFVCDDQHGGQRIDQSW